MTTADVTFEPKARHFLRSDSIAALAGSLAKAQGEMTGAAKDSANPFYRTKYADLASVWDACRAPLAANGLAIMQFARSTDGGIEVETIMAHESGEWVSEVLEVPATVEVQVKDKDGKVTEKVDRFDAQTIGSAITYARRYALSAMVGVAPEEDDGNEASQGSKAKPRQSNGPPEESLHEKQWNILKALLTPEGQKALLKHFKVAGPRAMYARQFDDAMFVIQANKAWQKQPTEQPIKDEAKPTSIREDQRNEIDRLGGQLELSIEGLLILSDELFGVNKPAYVDHMTADQADLFIAALRAKLGEATA